jgi:hypothetical protein
MEEAISNFSNIFITLAVSIVIAGFVGYILVPLVLKKFGVQKSTRIIISKGSVAVLLVVVFLNAFQSLST